jgi:hypothetical protein
VGASSGWARLRRHPRRGAGRLPPGRRRAHPWREPAPGPDDGSPTRRLGATHSASVQGPTGPRRAPGAQDAGRCQERGDRATPHPRQTRARPSGWPGEGEVAWRRVSPSGAVKGGWAPAAPFSPALAPVPWSLRPAGRVDGPAHGRDERAVGFAALPGQPRGTPRARRRAGRRGSRVHGTAGRALPPAADVTRPRAAAVRKTVPVSATPGGSPLPSLYELLARGPLEQSLVKPSGHLLCMTIPQAVSNQTVHQTR